MTLRTVPHYIQPTSPGDWRRGTPSSALGGHWEPEFEEQVGQEGTETGSSVLTCPGREPGREAAQAEGPSSALPKKPVQCQLPGPRASPLPLPHPWVLPPTMSTLSPSQVPPPLLGKDLLLGGGLSLP